MTPVQLTRIARDKAIVTLYRKIKNLSEVGRRYKLSRERIRQIVSLSTR